MSHAEIGAVLRTTKDPALKNDALLLETCLRFLEPIDGRTAVSLAEAFARQAPGDNRAGELLYLAAAKLDDGWYSRVGLIVILAVAGALTLWTARKRRGGTSRGMRLAKARGSPGRAGSRAARGPAFQPSSSCRMTGRPRSTASYSRDATPS